MYKPISAKQVKLMMGQMATEENISIEAIKLYESMVHAYNQDPGLVLSGTFRMGLRDVTLKNCLRELIEAGYVSRDTKKYLPLVVFKSNFWRQLNDLASSNNL